MLAGLDRLRDQIGAHLRGRGIEEHGVVRVLQRGGEIGGRARDAVLLAERRDLLGVAADQDRIGHHAVAVRQRDAALLADRQDRAHEVLVQPHASGDAVHDDAEPMRRHGFLAWRMSRRVDTGSPIRHAQISVGPATLHRPADASRGGAIEISTWPPSSITRFGGMRKNSVADSALRCIASNTCERKRPPARLRLRNDRHPADEERRVHHVELQLVRRRSAASARGMFGLCMKP